LLEEKFKIIGGKKLAFVILTGLGIGKIKYAPGTFGSLLALPLIILIGKNSLGLFLVSIILFALAIILLKYTLHTFNNPDPPEVVIDEIIGYSIIYIFIQPTFQTIVIGFFLFRIFDILKIFPIKQCEKLPNGYGIILDDVVAGVFSAIILYLFLFLSRQK
jgi:phosphatidylglycerophosphatase A